MSNRRLQDRKNIRQQDRWTRRQKYRKTGRQDTLSPNHRTRNKGTGKQEDIKMDMKTGTQEGRNTGSVAYRET